MIVRVGVDLDPAACARLAPVLMAGQDKLRRDGLGHVAARAAADVEAVLRAAQVAPAQPKLADRPVGRAPSTMRGSSPSARPVTVAEAASRLGVSKQYVRRLAASSRIDGWKVGTTWILDKEDLDALRQRRQGPAPGRARAGAGPAGD